MKGAKAIVESLKAEDVKHVFGIQGGAIMEVYDVFYDTPTSTLRHILMRHEQCVTPDTKILMNGTGVTEIGSLEENFEGRRVISYDNKSNTMTSVEITNFFRYNPAEIGKSVFKLVTKETGRKIKATESHPFWTKDGWKNLSEIRIGEKVGVCPTPEVQIEHIEGGIILNEQDCQKALSLCLRDEKAKNNILNKLQEKELLPLKRADKRVPILARLIGHLFGDGGLSRPCFDKKRKEYAVYVFFTGFKNDLKPIRLDIEKLGFKVMPPYSQKKRSKVITRGKEHWIDGTSTQSRSNSKALWVLLASLGVPTGSKADTEYLIPEWILKGTKQIKREFLAAYCGSECRKPSPRTNRAFSLPYIHFHKLSEYRKNGEEFAEQIYNMFKEFDINTRRLKIQENHTLRKDGSSTVGIDIYLSSNKDLLNFSRYVGFEYSIEKKILTSHILEYLEMIQYYRKNWKLKKKQAESLLGEGGSRSEVMRELNISKGVLDNWMYRKNSGENMPLSQIPKFEEWQTETTEGLNDGLVWETVAEILPIEADVVMDLTVENTHSFIANGFLVHNCAAHAAEGYARVSGKPGVCFATSGPGATNLVTGIADAWLDCTPIVAFTGQVPTHLIGNDAFQEADIIGITMPITKHNFQIMSPDDIPTTIKTAFKIAMTRRQGPVLIDLPKDIQQEELKKKFVYPKDIELPGYKVIVSGGHPRQLKDAVKTLLNAKRPVILAGGGVIISEGSKELQKLATSLNIPIATTLLGKGCIPEEHPLALGMVGMHGRKVANVTISESDVIFAIGMRMSDRVASDPENFAKNKTIIHADIDPAEIGKNVKVDIPIVGDAKLILNNMIKLVGKMKPKSKEWASKVKKLKKEYAPFYDYDDVPIKPQRIMKELNALIDNKTIIVTEVGQCQMWAAHFLNMKNPRTFLSSGGLGTMGSGFPMAIGAKIAKPDHKVVDVAGDGSFIMTCQDLATCVVEDIPVTVVVQNNRYLGMVKQWQDLFYDKRRSHTYLGEEPDFVKLAQAFGAKGIRVERPSEIHEALKKAMTSDKPHVIDIPIDPDEHILPMVRPGGRLDSMIEKTTHLKKKDKTVKPDDPQFT